MDKIYADTVRLLLQVTPDVFRNDIFAMKGGTAINLFVRDMPRLSVDIDVVYLPRQVPRDQALSEIAAELDAVATRLSSLGVRTRTVPSGNLDETKLVVENAQSQVKVEVNVVFRGTVLPPERQALTARTAEMFSAELEAPMLAQAGLIRSMIANVRATLEHVKAAAQRLPKIDRWRTLLANICQRIVGQIGLPTPPPTLLATA